MSAGEQPERASVSAPPAPDAATPAVRPARGRGAGVQAEALVVPLTIVALVIALSILTDSFLVRGNLINVLTQMATLAIVAFGVTIVMIGGNFDLSVGSQVALHGSVSAIVMSDTGSIWLGVLAGLVTGALFGLLNGSLVAGLSMNPFIATLGTLVMGRGIALAVTDARPVTGLPEGLQSFGLGTVIGLPWLVWVMLGCFLIAVVVVHVTPFGLRVFATGGNREAARLAGIRVKRVTISTFIISGLFAAVAGIALTARLRSGQPTVGELLELFAVAAVVLGGSSLYGGRGSVWRTLFGVMLIAIIQNGLNLLNVPAPYQQIAIGAVFIIAASSEFVRTLGRRRAR